MEKLCLLLNCTPDHLFQWTPDKSVKKPENLPINKLNRPSRGYNVNDKMRDLSADKQNIIREFILQMEKKDKGE